MTKIRPNTPKNKPEDDNDAVRRILEGDNSAYSYLQKKYHRVISSLIRRMVKNQDDVDDLVQETFIKAYNALPSFHTGYSFPAWLYRIASNTCIDFLRKKRFSTVSLTRQNPGSDEEQTIELEDRSFLPDMNVLSEERRKVLLAAIESLPENYRRIIKLRHEEEMDYTDISKVLDLPMGTVKAHLFRARKILYDNLKKKKYLFY